MFYNPNVAKEDFIRVYQVWCRDTIRTVTPSYFFWMRYDDKNQKYELRETELEKLMKNDYKKNYFSILTNALEEIRNRLETQARME